MNGVKRKRNWMRYSLLGVMAGFVLNLGADWSPPEQVSFSPGVSTAPTVTCSPSGQVFLSWQEGAEFNYPEIYFSKRGSGGWTSALNMSGSASQHSNMPGIGYLPGRNTLCLIWYEEESMLSSAVYYRKSSDGGNSWSSAELLSSGMEATSQFPHFVVDRQGIGHLVWSELFTDHTEPYFDIVYRRFDGNSWSAQENASRTKTQSADHPSVWGQGSASVSVLYLNNNKTIPTEADWSIVTAWKDNGGWQGPRELYRAGMTPIFTRVVRTIYNENYFFFHTRGPGVGDLYYCYQKSPGSPVSAAKHFAGGIRDKTRFSAVEGRSGAVHVFSGGPGGLFHHLFEDGVMSQSETISTLPSEGPCAYYQPERNQIHLAFQNSQNNEIYYTIGQAPFEGDVDPNVNRRPTARISMDRSEGLAPLTVQFSAANSNDRDGQIVDYAWTFGDGVTAKGVETSHVYTGSGDYSVTLRVEDDQGASDTAYAAVHALGIEPPLYIRAHHHTNRTVFLVEHFYRVVWQKNTVNDERGFNIVAYNIYRRRQGEGHFSLIGRVESGEELKFLDRSLKSIYIPYLYSVTAVDADGRESALPLIY